MDIIIQNLPTIGISVLLIVLVIVVLHFLGNTDDT
jgi:hypothetical protein